MHGIHTALVTPFTSDGSLDLEAYERLCARQIDGGIHGLVACGTTGESPTLTTQEWTAVVEATRRVAAGRVPVTAGVGTNDTRTSVEKAAAAKELGVDAGLLVLPYYNKPNPAGLRAHVREIARVGLPLVLYHVPGRTAQTLPASLLAELAAFDGVIGVKEATGDLRYGGDLIARVATPVLSGDDFTFLPLLTLGGTGCISVLSNVAPSQTVAIYDRFVAGDVQEATFGMHRLWDLVTFLFAEVNPVPCKAALAELGLCRSDTRLPLAPYSGPSPRAILDAALG
ncbi:MAG: 4-hydroxy-tetrahydrodipicolinate synthase [Deltaproteobacteria bacterium]|nr:4-hydroxy-tetrahydrodipicolinate synthase [Deltaproteobacteria bacterium]